MILNFNIHCYNNYFLADNELFIPMENDGNALYENNDEINDVQLLHRGQLVRNKIIHDFFM